MSKLFVVLALALSSIIPSADVSMGEAVASVRVAAKDGDRNCSAVVIAPGKAISALHCLTDGFITTIDGYPIHSVDSADQVNDTVVFNVPGLPCPCTPVSKVMPTKGETVLVVGFPFGGERMVRELAVFGVMRPQDLGQYFADAKGTEWDRPFLILEDGVRPGDSGGGMFVKRNGSYELVAINDALFAIRGMPVASAGTPLSEVTVNL